MKKTNSCVTQRHDVTADTLGWQSIYLVVARLVRYVIIKLFKVINLQDLDKVLKYFALLRTVFLVKSLVQHCQIQQQPSSHQQVFLKRCSASPAYVGIFTDYTILEEQFKMSQYNGIFVIRSRLILQNMWLPLRKKCPQLELSWSAFSRIRTEYGKIGTRITPNIDTSYTVVTFYQNKLSQLQKMKLKQFGISVLLKLRTDKIFLK